MSLDIDSTTDTGDMSLALPVRLLAQVNMQHAVYCTAAHSCPISPSILWQGFTTLEKGCGVVNSNSVEKSCCILCNLFLDKG